MRGNGFSSLKHSEETAARAKRAIAKPRAPFPHRMLNYFSKPNPTIHCSSRMAATMAKGTGPPGSAATQPSCMRIQLAQNVRVANSSTPDVVTVFRGIPTTINSPAVDPVIMLDGRQPDLQSQALSAIKNHAQATLLPNLGDLDRIKAFELTNEFFSSPEVRKFAEGGRAPELPRGNTASEQRGRRFFEDVVDFADAKHGLCAGCHAGPMLNETNLFAQIVFGVPKGTRFQTILVSEFNDAKNPVQEFVFNKGTASEKHYLSPDIGRSAITGVTLEDDITFSNFNAFKIPQIARHSRYRSLLPRQFRQNAGRRLESVRKVLLPLRYLDPAG